MESKYINRYHTYCKCLENLEKRFNGTNEQMLDIWNACKDYDASYSVKHFLPTCPN